MNTKQLIARFRQNFASHEWTRSERRAYRNQWVRKVQALGGSWRALP